MCEGTIVRPMPHWSGPGSMTPILRVGSLSDTNSTANDLTFWDGRWSPYGVVVGEEIELWRRRWIPVLLSCGLAYVRVEAVEEVK